MLALSPEDHSAKYSEVRETYADFSERLSTLIEELITASEIDVAKMEFRAKTVDSFLEKIQRDGKSYNEPLTDVTDLAGVRVIVYYTDDVDKVYNVLKSEFNIDETKTEDKTAKDPDRFGYLSKHYIVSIKEPRGNLGEWKRFSGIKAEVQVKTILQHAWAAIDHKNRYKSKDEIPKNIARKLFRISALLEVADDEFLAFRKMSEEQREYYRKSFKKGGLSAEINADSIEIYSAEVNLISQWAQICAESGIVASERYAALGRDKLLKTTEIIGLHSISEFDKLVKKAQPLALEFFSDVLDKHKEISGSDTINLQLAPYSAIRLGLLIAIDKDRANLVLEKVPFADKLNAAVKNSLERRN